METNHINDNKTSISGYLIACRKCGVSINVFFKNQSYLLYPESAQSVECGECKARNYLNTSTVACRVPKGIETM